MTPRGIMRWAVDRDDRLVDWNAAWASFAEENSAPGLPARAAGTNLFDHITGEEVRELHRRLLAAARAGRRIEFDFSCDSPEKRRLFRLRMSADPAGAVRYESWLLVASSERTLAPDLRVIRLCSWCARIDDEGWRLPEQVIARRGLLTGDRPPRVTHAICEDCYARVGAEFGIPPE